MATQVQICNLALMNIGVRSITSLTEASEAARRCALVYDAAVEAVLREHDWNFANRTESLALISGETLDGWEYVYMYPSNCLNPLKIKDEDGSAPDVPYVFKVQQSSSGASKSIATDVVNAKLEYTAKISDEAMFDSSFVEALSYKLAAMLAQPLTKNTTLAGNMFTLYQSVMLKAKSVNKNEGNYKSEPTSSYIDARG